ncbi:hypothetical protein SEVIR_8G195400v4 [Setaria viridis]|uniref:Uncharacterized protein n=1 Tax=Setaria viridis TaxID=4556 RepID=A0A4U6TH52_SETVI|nr:hypothetical protein SEVIR_8G195400v2 [Setaria viridis]
MPWLTTLKKPSLLQALATAPAEPGEDRSTMGTMAFVEMAVLMETLGLVVAVIPLFEPRPVPDLDPMGAGRGGGKQGGVKPGSWVAGSEGGRRGAWCTIIRRIVANYEAYQKRNQKKEVIEKKYYESKNFVNGE